MPVFCCCPSSRSTKNRSSSNTGAESALPAPPPAARLQGPRASNLPNPSYSAAAGSLAPSYKSKSRSTVHLANPVTVITVDNALELNQIVADDSDSDDEMRRVPNTKSTSTLQLVKTRIKRHLSQDSMSRRKAQSTGGSCDESIARRAELKRFMHKRIQEELRDEEVHDNHTMRTDGSSLSNKERMATASSVEELPGGGPRDALEFSVVDVPDESNTGARESATVGSYFFDAGLSYNLGMSARMGTLMTTPSSTEREPGPVNRRMSAPGWSGGGKVLSRLSIAPSASYSMAAERSSLPDIPSLGDIAASPKKAHSASPPSSRNSPSVTSWRRSLSSGHVKELFGFDRASGGKYTSNTDAVLASSPAKQLISPSQTFLTMRSLSRSHSSPGRHATLLEGSSDRSPMFEVWLKSQEIVGNNSESNDTNHPYVKRWNSVQNRAVPDAPFVAQSPGGRWHEHKRIDSIVATSRPRRPSRLSQQLDMVDVKESLLGDMANDGSGETATNGLAAGSVSQCPSVVNSAHVCPRATVVSPQGTRHKSLLGVRLPSWQYQLSMPELVRSRNPVNDVTTAPAQSHNYKVQISSDHKTHAYVQRTPTNSFCGSTTRPRDIVDSGSLNHSEASSFVRREAELQTIDKRFRDSHLRTGRIAPVTSKFRENFGKDDAIPSAARASLLTRFNMTIPKRARLSPARVDGTDEDFCLRPASLSRQPSKLSSAGPSQKWLGGRGRLSSNVSTMSRTSVIDDGDETAEMWQRAISQEARCRGMGTRGSSGFQSKGPGSDDPSRRSSFASNRRPTSGKHLNQKSAEHFRTGTLLAPPGLESTARSRSSSSDAPIPSNIFAQFQVNQHQNSSTQACTEPNSPLTQRPRNAISPSRVPKSWARFPSHDRAQRNCSAGPSDGVTPRDFAANPDAAVATEASAVPDMKAPKSLSGKLSKAFRSGLQRLLPSRDKVHAKPTKSQRGSKKKVEYPELELLPVPTGYQEMQIIGHAAQNLAAASGLQYPRTIEEHVALPRMSTTISRRNSGEEAPTLLGAMSAEHISKRPATPFGFLLTNNVVQDTKTPTEKHMASHSRKAESHESLSFHSHGPARLSTALFKARSAGDVTLLMVDAASVKSRETACRVPSSTTAPDVVSLAGNDQDSTSSRIGKESACSNR